MVENGYRNPKSLRPLLIYNSELLPMFPLFGSHVGSPYLQVLGNHDYGPTVQSPGTCPVGVDCYWSPLHQVIVAALHDTCEYPNASTLVEGFQSVRTYSSPLIRPGSSPNPMVTLHTSTLGERDPPNP